MDDAVANLLGIAVSLPIGWKAAAARGYSALGRPRQQRGAARSTGRTVCDRTELKAEQC